MEIKSFERRAVREIKFAMPSWWGEVEVPYGFHNEMALLVAYVTLAHLDGATEVALSSEWKYIVARQLLYEARSGRLWWLPVRVGKDMRAFLLAGPTISRDD